MYPKILIVEDEVLIADYIENILSENNFKNVKTAHDREDAELCITRQNPDIMILDINLSGKNEGIPIAENHAGKASIIFLTGQQDHQLMSQAIATGPHSYLTKPIKKNDLIAALHLAVSARRNGVYVLKDGFSTMQLKYSEILYFKADKNYVEVHLPEKKYVDRTSLKTIEEAIPFGFNYRRVHRSFVVNMDKVTKINTKNVYIEELEIPLGRVHFNKG
jgi:DNA-binding LytR/AlgR family response regulator